jgi:hypothetical protein
VYNDLQSHTTEEELVAHPRHGLSQDISHKHPRGQITLMVHLLDEQF